MHKGINSTLDEGQTPVVTHTLRGEGFDASEDGTGRGTPLVPVAFHPTQDPISSTDVCHSLGANDNATAAVAIADTVTAKWAKGADVPPMGHSNGNLVTNWDGSETSQTLTSRLYGGLGAQMMPDKGNMGAVIQAMQVRRLTPVECERLQGFPDNYTNIPWRGKAESPDGPRYKALGNSWAVPVVRWIGARIQQALGKAPS